MIKPNFFSRYGHEAESLREKEQTERMIRAKRKNFKEGWKNWAQTGRTCCYLTKRAGPSEIK